MAPLQGIYSVNVWLSGIFLDGTKSLVRESASETEAVKSDDEKRAAKKAGKGDPPSDPPDDSAGGHPSGASAPSGGSSGDVMGALRQIQQALNGGANQQSGTNNQPSATITDSDLLNSLHEIQTALSATGRNPLASNQPTVTGAKNTLAELLKSLSDILPNALFGAENANGDRLPDLGAKNTVSEILRVLKEMERYFSSDSDAGVNGTVIMPFRKDGVKATEQMQLSVDIANKNASDIPKLLTDMQMSLKTPERSKNDEVLKALYTLKDSLHGGDDYSSSSVDDQIRRLVDDIMEYLHPSSGRDDSFNENANNVQSEIMRMLAGIQQTLYALAKTSDTDTLNSLTGVQASLNHISAADEMFHPSINVGDDYPVDADVVPIRPVPIRRVPIRPVPIGPIRHFGTQAEILRTLSGIGKSLMRANKFLKLMRHSLHHGRKNDDDDYEDVSASDSDMNDAFSDITVLERENVGNIIDAMRRKRKPGRKKTRQENARQSKEIVKSKKKQLAKKKIRNDRYTDVKERPDTESEELLNELTELLQNRLRIY